MRSAYTVDAVRTAEQALMATVPSGALMQRAASGLAAACADLLGGGYGRRILVLAGSGVRTRLRAGQRRQRPVQRRHAASTLLTER